MTVSSRPPEQRVPARQVRTLAIASLLCVVLVAGRVLWTGRLGYLFLCWNLFLAWVPLAASLALTRWPTSRAAWPLGALWLAFFPNAPYLVTDLIHLKPRVGIPFWFDALMLFAFALAGLFAAFVSLRLVHGLVERRWGRRPGWAFVAAVALLTGFGVYLGRFQRWNSWDLVVQPVDLLADAVRRVLDSATHTLGITVMFASLFAGWYLLLLALSRAVAWGYLGPLPGDAGAGDGRAVALEAGAGGGLAPDHRHPAGPWRARRQADGGGPGPRPLG